MESAQQLSPDTIRLAHLALYHMELGVRSWAEMPDEENARVTLAKIQRARRELIAALPDEAA